MTNHEIEQLVSSFKAQGGKVKVFRASRKKVKTWRGKAGAWNRGAKKVGLQDRNFQS
jgi:hypothetical protein